MNREELAKVLHPGYGLAPNGFGSPGRSEVVGPEWFTVLNPSTIDIAGVQTGE
ncbi:MAG: hypothetical protein ABSB26_08220 [Nitrososphaerales archaeon]